MNKGDIIWYKEKMYLVIYVCDKFVSCIQRGQLIGIHIIDQPEWENVKVIWKYELEEDIRL